MDESILQFQAEDRERLERGSIFCWNQTTRFLDKFVEVLFIGILSLLAIWNFIDQFFSSTKKFGFGPTLLSAYLLGLAGMIYLSWTANLKFLVYFGFMQSHLPKSMFFLFCACMTLPGHDGDYFSGGPTGDKTLSYLVSILLILAALVQLLKLCNKNDEQRRLDERERYDQEQAFKQTMT